MKRKACWVLAVIALFYFSGCATSPRQSAEVSPPPNIGGPPPREAETLWQKGEHEYKAGNTASAISLWERIVQNYPNSALAAKALQRVGAIYLEQGQAERSLQYFEYILYAYPQWEGINQTKLDRLQALWRLGKKKQVLKEATPLWEAAAGQPEIQGALSQLMVTAYASEGDTETAFDWLAAGFSAAQTPDEKNRLVKVGVDLLKDQKEGVVRKLYKRNPSDYMRVFLDFRLAQIELQEGKQDAGREALKGLIKANPGHPLISEMQAALRGVPGGVVLPLHADRIGCLVPVNGPYGKYGEMVLRGLSLASTDWNGKHPDQPVTLVVKDAQNDSEQAARSLEELAQKDGVLGVIGPLGTQAAKAVTPLANQLGVPLLALTQKEEPEDQMYVVHVFLDNRELLKALVRHCRQKLNFTRFATLYPDDRYGQKLSKLFAEVVQEQGGEVMASVPYKEKSTDFKEPIQKLMTIAKKNAPPSGVDTAPFDALFLPDQVQTVSLIAPQLPFYNVVGVTLLGTNLWGDGPLVQAGGVYVEQAIFATPFLADNPAPRAKGFIERYQETYGATPSYLEAQAYDALMLLLNARSASKSSAMDRSAVLQSLMNIRRFEGVAGTYSFTAQGVLERDYQLFQVINGQLVQVSP